jgi:predicted AlkP superfamily pyrophosphatase or phosphodiesterase
MNNGWRKIMLIRKLVVFLLLLGLTACSSLPWVPNTQVATSSPTTTANPVLPTLPSPKIKAETPTTIPLILPTEAPPPQYLVLIVLDAFRPEYLSLADMPNLKSLILSGTSYSGAWNGALENYTPTAHTMMSTGSLPRRNGISGYTWQNLQTNEYFNPTTEEAVNRGEMAAIVQKSGVPTLAGAIKARWPDAIVAALSDEKYYAAQALGMGPADYILYSGNDGNTETVIPKVVNGHAPPQEFMTDPRLRTESHDPGSSNAYVLHMASVLVEKYKPRAVLMNLPESDNLGHASGGLTDPESMHQVLDGTDLALGELMNTYRQAGIFDQTLWVITSDHGMTPKLNVIVPKELFQELGIEISPEDDAPLPDIDLKDPSRAEGIAEKIAAAHIPGILGAYVREKNGDQSTYRAAPSTLDSLPPALNNAFLYLTNTFAGPYSPNIVITTSGGTVFDKTHEGKGGSHSMDNWIDQHIFMAFSGPGIVNGAVSIAPARLVDILPTVARLMRLPLEGADGIVLADAIHNATTKDLVAMAEMNLQLAPLRDALAATGK